MSIAIIISIISLLLAIILCGLLGATVAGIGPLKVKDVADGAIQNINLDGADTFDMAGLNLNDGLKGNNKIYLYNTKRGRLEISDTEFIGIGTHEEYLLNWNYVRDQPPWFGGQSGNVATGVITVAQWQGSLGDHDTFNVIFPNARNLGPTRVQFLCIEAFAHPGVWPWAIKGTVPSVDTPSTYSGANFSMNAGASDNVGFEMSLTNGDGTSALNCEKFISGTDFGYIDITIFSPDWTKFDCFVIGFRKEQAAITNFPYIISNAVSGGAGVYSDYAVFGVIGVNKLGSMSDAVIGHNNSTYTDAETSLTNSQSQNLRLRVNLDKVGSVTYQVVQNEIAGQGTLTTPDGFSSLQYTFKSSLNLLPFVSCLSRGSGGVMLVKEIKIVRYTN